ncbi:MAG: c-type cytochrome domain-containing protein [Limisphaerales bacterium]
MIIKTIALVLLGSAGLALADGTNLPPASIPPASTKAGVTYDTDIKPIFDSSCLRCHTSTKNPKAHLALDSLAGVLKGSENGPVIVPGDSSKSILVKAVAHVGDPFSWMPKGFNTKKLSDDQIGLIRAWIDQGAK